MAHLMKTMLSNKSVDTFSMRRKPTSSRGSCIVRAQFPDNFDPYEAQRPFDDHNQHKFFAIDGHPPVLEQDWRLFRAQLVAKEVNGSTIPASPMGTLVRPTDSWAHPIPHPEQGCLLVARNSNLGMFSHSVVLVTEHDDSAGTSALVLNMPTPLYISNLGLDEDISNAFGHSPLFIGGPMTRNLLHVLHGRADVDRSMRILDGGLFAGGVESAAELIRLGLAKPEEFRLLAGYSGWGPNQLAREIAEGSWYCVAASHQLILDCLKETADWNPSGGFLADTDDVKYKCWQKVLNAAGIRH